MMQLAFIFFFFLEDEKSTIFSLFFEIFKIFHKKNIKLPNYQTFVKVKNKNSKIDNIKEYSKIK